MAPPEPTPAGRSGRVVCRPLGERWTVELQLTERDGAQTRHTAIRLNRTFVTEAVGLDAGEQVIAEWTSGRTDTRGLMLNELSGTYRRMRETQSRMQPPTVPTTRSAWERAIATWETLAWIDADEAAHLRDHVHQVLAPESGVVPLRRLPPAEESSPAP